MKCPKCQTENPDGAQFCGVCGQSLKIEGVCPACGHVSSKEFQFCNRCGHSLTLQSSAPSPTKPPSPAAPTPLPTSFANGRYQVKKFLGEGGKKKVYLAHDNEALISAATSLLDMPSLNDSELSNISTPCLVFCGELDPRCSGAKAGANHILKAQFFSLPGLDHAPTFDHPDLVLPRVKEFLSR